MGESRAKSKESGARYFTDLIMVEPETFKRLALSFPDTEELPHFDMTSFRWRMKIFATFRSADNRAMVKLALIDQDVFCVYDNGSTFYPVPGSWGKQGSTFVNLGLVTEDMLEDALGCAYRALVEKYGGKK